MINLIKNGGSLQAAIRETSEEVGLNNLEYKGFLGSCFKFYLFKDKPSRVLEHYYYFEIDLKNWKSKSLDEVGMQSKLVGLQDIEKQNWNQQLWALDKLRNLLK